MKKNLRKQLEDSILAKKSLLNQNKNINIAKEIIYNYYFVRFQWEKYYLENY